MSIFRIQKIRSCVTCGTMLSTKCETCAAHPDRKPKIVEFFDWPAILQTAACGCCIQFSCQNDACRAKVWRFFRTTKSGLSRSANLYCSRKCHLQVSNKALDTRVPVPCGWCGKSILRRALHVKTFKAAYCRPDHYYLSISKKRHEEKQALVKAKDAIDRALLECRGKCKDITEHNTTTDTASCLKCGAKRSHAFKVDAA